MYLLNKIINEQHRVQSQWKQLINILLVLVLGHDEEDAGLIGSW